MSSLRRKVSTIDYPAHLEMMWGRAIAPRDQSAPAVVSTFAGCGGSLTGYMMAGYNDLLAVEWDDNAVETLRANWPTLDVHHGDIAKLSVGEVLERTGLKPGELDILDGSPPCQGFSVGGRRVMSDSRNQLFHEYVRLLVGLQPKVFVMENVSGLVIGKMKLIFAEILRELKLAGYRVSARLLNAMYFHVPQSRERLVFIGVRNDLDVEPSHPGAESLPITVKNAFSNCSAWQVTSPDYNTAFGKCCIGMRQGQSADSFWKPNWSFQTKRLSLHRVAPTVTKKSSLIHQTEPRCVSGAELKRIGSFPDAYIFLGSRQNTWDRIGNSVPPLMMEAIARHIKERILQ